MAPERVLPEPWFTPPTRGPFSALSLREFEQESSRTSDSVAAVIAALAERVKARRVFTTSPALTPIGLWPPDCVIFTTSGDVPGVVGLQGNGDPFGAVAPLDLAFVSQSDRDATLAAVRSAYAALRPGGYLIWTHPTGDDGWVSAMELAIALPFAEPVHSGDGTAVSFLLKAPVRREARPLVLTWVGEFTAEHSLALVNRCTCAELRARGNLVTAAPGGRPHLPADLQIRHAYPPDLSPPPVGSRVALVVAWEFGSLPRAWLQPLCEPTVEAWVYSLPIRDCLLTAGVPGDRVHVVPLGVDTDRFRPGLAPLPLQTRKSTRFLYVGARFSARVLTFC